MKRALIGIISVLVVLVIGLLVAPGFFDWNQYKPQAVSAFKDKTGLDVVMNGDVKVALLPTPYAYINDVVIKSPREGQYENIASLGRLDLNLAFAPLLSGKVDFTSVELVKPAIYIETYADGSQNWKTEEIASLIDGEEGAAIDEPVAAENNNTMLSSISFNKVEISEGSFSFYNHATQSEQVIDNITAAMRADTLSGPFTIDGSVRHGSRAIKFSAKTGRLDSDAGSVPLNATATLSPDDVEVVYSGIIDTSGAFEVLGETQLIAEDVAELLSSLGVVSPVIKSSSLNAKGLLSATAEKISFENANIVLGESAFRGKIDGAINPMQINIDLNSERLNLQSSFDMPALAQVRSASIKGSVQLTDKGVRAQDMVVKLDDTSLQGSINYNSGADRPKVDVVLRSDNLDLNKFIPPSQKSGNSPGSGSTGTELKQTLSKSEIPVDLSLDADIAKGRYGDYSFSGITAKGGVVGNAVNIGNLSIADFAGSKISAQGSVANYKTLNGADMTLSLVTDNVTSIAKALSLDLSALPEGIKAVDARIQTKGAIERMDVTANIKAMNGEVIASGLVGDILGTMTISDLDLQVRHPNFNQALNAVQPGAGSFQNLNKPLDFYARVSKNAGGYDLTDIKANVSGIPATGQAGLDLSGDKPFLRGDISLGDVLIGNKAAGGREVSASGAGGSGSQNTGWSRETLDSSWMNAMNFDVRVVAKSINYEGWAMAQPSLKAKLNNGTLNLEQLQTGLYQGQLNLNGTMKPANGNNGYSVNGDANLRDVSLEPLVGSLTGNRILKGRGLISSDVKINAAGLSPAALVSSLGGNGTLTGRDIILTGFDLARFARAMSSETKPGDTALGVWKSATKGGSTQFDTMDGEFTIHEGIVNISSIKMDGPKAFMDTTGTVNVPQYTIATTHKISLKEEDIPEFEINIKGPLNNPAQTFGQGVLNDYISRKVNRKLQDLISDKLGDKLGLPKAQSQAQPQDNAESAHEGVSETEVEPAANENATTEQQQQQPDNSEPEEAIRGLLQGLLKQ